MNNLQFTPLKMNNQTPPSMDNIWSLIKQKLKPQLGSATFKSWIEPLKFISYEEEVLILAAPTEFIASWIEGHYLSKIKDLSPEPLNNVEIIVNASEKSKTQNASKAVEKKVLKFADYKASIGSKIDPRFSFDSFVTAPSNEVAVAASKRVAESGAQAGFNPLFLHSGVGLGKTHLMHAVANYCAENKKELNVIYLSAEKFLHTFIRSIKDRNTLEFKEQLRAADILMIDDFQFINGKNSTQEEFFHTLNALVESGKQIIISCDRCPAEFEELEERMRSRLSSGLVVGIEKAGYELRLQILKVKLQDKDIEVSDEVLEFLAERITSNIRELEGALNRIIARASLVGSKIDIQSSKEWLADLLKIKAKEVTIEGIQAKVAGAYGITTADLLSTSRSQKIARPRQVAMSLAKKLTTKSLYEIGKLFGGKDHATVIHACKKVEELVSKDEAFANKLDFLTESLRSC